MSSQRTVRTASLTAATALVASLLVALGVPATATAHDPVREAPAAQTTPVVQEPVALPAAFHAGHDAHGDLTHTSPRYRPRKWPRGRIRYFDASKDKPLVKKAVKIWNKSGIRVRFIKVKSPRRAQLIIRNTTKVPSGCGSGYGTLGKPPRGKAYVSILHEPNPTGIGCSDFGQTHVIVHELGHVLGFDHIKKTCSVMNPSHNGYGGQKCKNKGSVYSQYRCRYLEKVDLRRAKKMYGGKIKLRKPAWCDLYTPIATTQPINVYVDAATRELVMEGVVVSPDTVRPTWLPAPLSRGFKVSVKAGSCETQSNTKTSLGYFTIGDQPLGTPLRWRLPLPAPGPTCVTAWESDSAGGVATVPATFVLDVPALRASARSAEPELSPSVRPEAPRAIRID